jgi:hypothetical protein
MAQALKYSFCQFGYQVFPSSQPPETVDVPYQLSAAPLNPPGCATRSIIALGRNNERMYDCHKVTDMLFVAKAELRWIA